MEEGNHDDIITYHKGTFIIRMGMSYLQIFDTDFIPVMHLENQNDLES